LTTRAATERLIAVPEAGPSLRQESREFVVATRGAGFYEITRQVVDWVCATGILEGLLTLHVRHTSASLLVQENADPEVRRDLERFFGRLVPRGDPLFRHVAEGPDDMPAHVRSALTPTALSIPVASGSPALGTWQGIYLYEHRDAAQRRRIAAHLIGSG
jgi:secondary thiamine-phosphate synthase enzyme